MTIPSRPRKLFLFAAFMFSLVTCSYGDKGSDDYQLFQMCAMWSTCDFPTSRSGMGMLCHFDFQQYNQRESRGTTEMTITAFDNCMRGAKTCEEFAACESAPPDLAEDCVHNQERNICKGDILVMCGDYPVDEVPYADCSNVGLVCGEGDVTAHCGLDTCDPATTEPYCDGDLAIYCMEGANVLRAIDCKFDHKGTCGNDLDGNIACIGTGDPCDPDAFAGRCEGTQVVSCIGGKEAMRDCTSYYDEGVCTVLGTEALCRPPEFECMESTSETCEEGVVTFCLYGVFAQLDCRDFGFSGCDTELHDTRYAAYCVR